MKTSGDRAAILAPGSEEQTTLLERVKDGILIVAEGISLPASCNVTSEPFSQGWRAVTNLEGRGLDRRFSDIGWTVFQKAAPATVSVVGFGEARTIRKAFRKIIRRSGQLKFNCLEITQAREKTFIGITYVRMSARARNIQERP
ncbi:MAG TPA: hypothetical protein VF532_19260 [Candidatus Angelobacter sp.]